MRTITEEMKTLIEGVMSLDEFSKLSEVEQDITLATIKRVREDSRDIDADTKDLKTLPMKDFKGIVEDVFRNAIKSMDKTDKKFFMFPGTGTENVDDVTPEGKFTKTIKFLKAYAGGDVQTVGNMAKEVATKANLSEGTAASGGFLVPEEFKAEILRLAPIYGVIRRNVRIIPMMHDVMNIPAAGATNLDALFVGEAGQIKSTDPNFRQIALVINKLAAIPKVTSELLADANVDVIQYLAELIAEAFAKKEDDQGFNGTGSPFTGVLIGTGVPTTPHAGGTGFICLSYPDLVTTEGNIYSNLLANSKWYFHRTMLAHIRSRITTTGAPIFDSASRQILGYPYEGVEVLPGTQSSTAHTDATPYAIFGDMRRAMMMGERGAITMKISEEATVGSDNLFEQDMKALRMIERIAQSIALPSAITRIIS